MEVLCARCAGLDVHQKTVVACVRIHGPDGRAQTETRTFATDTAARLELSAWPTDSLTNAAPRSAVSRRKRRKWRDHSANVRERSGGGKYCHPRIIVGSRDEVVTPCRPRASNLCRGIKLDIERGVTAGGRSSSWC
jgi:hypothetical protein